MKILVVTNMAPFVWGGAEELAVHLQKNIIEAGHKAEVLRIPFQWEPPEKIPSQMLMARTFELTNVDRVIALKFPAYYIPHPHKTLWLLHQFRQAYDLYESEHTHLNRSPSGEEARRLIIEADNQTFRESRKIYTNSRVTSDRLKRFNGFDSEVLLPPVNDAEIFLRDGDEGYIFAGGRVNNMKRQHLLVEAMAHAPVGLKLIVAGPPDSAEDAAALHRLVSSMGLENRVKLDLRFLPRHEYARYINRSRAVAYIPIDEDSYGYVAMEGAMARKPILTCTDSGGVADFVLPNITGMLSAPTAQALSDALTSLDASPEKARSMGDACHDRWNALNINWDSTVERLLQ